MSRFAQVVLHMLRHPVLVETISAYVSPPIVHPISSGEVSARVTNTCVPKNADKSFGEGLEGEEGHWRTRQAALWWRGALSCPTPSRTKPRGPWHSSFPLPSLSLALPRLPPSRAQWLRSPRSRKGIPSDQALFIRQRKNQPTRARRAQTPRSRCPHRRQSEFSA